MSFGANRFSTAGRTRGGSILQNALPALALNFKASHPATKKKTGAGSLKTWKSDGKLAITTIINHH